MPMYRAELIQQQITLRKPRLHDKSQVLYLPFDKDDGSYARDRSGYSNHGAIYGATRVAGKVGGALSFDGVNDYARVPAGFLPTNAITVTLWIKAFSFSTSVWRKFINTGPTSISGISGGQTSLTVDSWIIYLSWDSAAVQRNVTLGSLVNVWKFAAIGWDGVNVYGGVNGAWSLLGAGGTNPDWAGRPLTLGANYQPGEYFNGVIDEVRIYNRALSRAEIQRLMNMRGI